VDRVKQTAQRIQRVLRTAVRLAVAGKDMSSRRALLKLRFRPSPPGRPVDVRVRQLGGESFRLRPGTSDIYAFGDRFVDFYHLPPPEIRDRELATIVDLGANIGVSLAALAVRYPRARLLGIEADSENAALAEANTAPWRDRCTIVNSACWDREADLVVEGTEASGYSVREAGPGDPAAVRSVRGRPLDALLPEGVIDYVVMEVEHTEQRLLNNNTAWAERVRALRVECYPEGEYRLADTVKDLTALGFRARGEPNPLGGYAIGIRDL
jgi:FkbM family methyltransferase